jgi:hypothetical protein
LCYCTDDAIIVQLSRLCRRDDFSLRSACFALLALLIALPSAIMNLGSMANDDLGNIESAADEMAATSEVALEEADHAGQVAGMASEGLSILYWLARPRQQHHAAADTIRHAFTRHRRRSSVGSEVEVAVRGGGGEGGRGASGKLAALVQLARSKSSGSSVGSPAPRVRFTRLHSGAAAAAEDDSKQREPSPPTVSPNRPATPVSPMAYLRGRIAVRRRIDPSHCVPAEPTRVKTRVRVRSYDGRAADAAAADAEEPPSVDVELTRTKTRIRVRTEEPAPADEAPARVKTRLRVRAEDPAVDAAPTRVKTRVRVRAEDPAGAV